MSFNIGENWDAVLVDDGNHRSYIGDRTRDDFIARIRIDHRYSDVNRRGARCARYAILRAVHIRKAFTKLFDFRAVKHIPRRDDLFELFQYFFANLFSRGK